MTHHDCKSKEKDSYETDSYRGEHRSPPKTVRLLGTQIEPVQFWLLFCSLAPFALLNQFGVFEIAGLNSLQTAAIVAPVVLVAIALAFIRYDGRYLHMALTEKRGNRKRQQRVNQSVDQREDERA